MYLTLNLKAYKFKYIPTIQIRHLTPRYVPKMKTYVHTKIYKQMSIASLFVIAKN